MIIEVKMILNGYVVSNSLSGEWIDEYCKDWDSMLECIKKLKETYKDKII